MGQEARDGEEMSMLRWIRTKKWSLFVALVVMAPLGCSKEMAGQSKEAEVSGQAPDFTLSDLEGEQFTLSSLKGKVVVLNFWGSWCPPCRSEIPDFISFYNEYGERGVEIVGVALERDGGVAVKSFVKEHGINYRVVLGDQEVTQKYGGIRAVPTTFVIDRSGIIRQKHVGAINKKTLEDDVSPLLQARE